MIPKIVYYNTLLGCVDGVDKQAYYAHDTSIVAVKEWNRPDLTLICDGVFHCRL